MCQQGGGAEGWSNSNDNNKNKFLLVFFHGYISHLELTETVSGFSCCTVAKFIVPDWGKKLTPA